MARPIFMLRSETFRTRLVPVCFCFPVSFLRSTSPTHSKCFFKINWIHAALNTKEYATCLILGLNWTFICSSVNNSHAASDVPQNAVTELPSCLHKFFHSDEVAFLFFYISLGRKPHVYTSFSKNKMEKARTRALKEIQPRSPIQHNHSMTVKPTPTT